MGVDTNTSTAPTTWTPTTNGANPALFINQQGSAEGLRVWTFDGDSLFAFAGIGIGVGVNAQSESGTAVQAITGGSNSGVFGQSSGGEGGDGYQRLLRRHLRRGSDRGGVDVAHGEPPVGLPGGPDCTHQQCDRPPARRHRH